MRCCIKACFFLICCFSVALAKLPASFARIKQAHVVRVAVLPEAGSPFLDRGKQGFQGFDEVLAEHLAKGLGVGLQFVPVNGSMRDLLNVVREGKADVAISAISLTLARAQLLHFSTPYLRPHFVLLINRLSSYRSNREDTLKLQISKLKPKIGVLKGTALVPFAKQFFPGVTLVPFATSRDLFRAIRSHQIVLGLETQYFASNFFKLHPSYAIYVRAQKFVERDNFCIVNRYDDIALSQWLNTFLQMQRDSGAVHLLSKRFLQELK